MKSKPKIWMSWSSGKDSAFALQQILKQNEFEVTRLLTTVTKDFDRVSMHGVRRELLEAQGKALGLPLEIVEIPSPCTNANYEELMAKAISAAKAQGCSHLAFGDLFLQDIRSYRERLLQNTGLTPLFPLWQRPTDKLAIEIIESGTQAVLTCVDTRKLDSSFSGRNYDKSLLGDFPNQIDPCGENGEFHTFVYDSPLFTEKINLQKGKIVVREGFAFCDFTLAEE